MKFFSLVFIFIFLSGFFSTANASEPIVYLEKNLKIESFFEKQDSPSDIFQKGKVALKDHVLMSRHSIDFMNTDLILRIEPNNWSNQGIFGVNFLVDDNSSYSLVFNSLTSHIYLKKNIGGESLTFKKKPHIFTIKDAKYLIKISLENNEASIWLGDNKIIWDDSEDHLKINSNGVGKLSLFSEYETTIFSDLYLLPNYPAFISPLQIKPKKDSTKLEVLWSTSYPTRCQIAYDTSSRVNEGKIDNYTYKIGSPKIRQDHVFVIENIESEKDYFARIKCGQEQTTITDETVISLPKVLGTTNIEDKAGSSKALTMFTGILTLFTFILFIQAQKKELRFSEQIPDTEILTVNNTQEEKIYANKSNRKKIHSFDTISRQ